MTQLADRKGLLGRKRLLGLTAAALIAGTAVTSGLYAAPSAELSARQAEAAMAKGKSSKAIAYAEQAVTAEPDNAQYRAVLGSAYLGAGRFLSAASAFGDAVTLGDASPRTTLSLALAQIGSGQTAPALASLDRANDSIAAADLGLAYALAGDTQRGIAILSDAIRNGEYTPKIRQNLAYALALAGDWRQARVMAAMDVPSEQIADRMAAWSATAPAEAFQQRVATLLNVPTVASDPGRPAALALTGGPAQQSADAMVAEAPPPPPPYRGGELPALGGSEQAAYSAPQPAQVSYNEAPAPAPVAPAPENYEAAFAAEVPQGATPAAVIADAIRFVSHPVVQTIPAQYVASRAPAPRAAAHPSRTARASTVPAATRSSGNHGIQLGSFLSEQTARQASAVYARQHRGLERSQIRITKASVNGRTYWRVSATGLSVADARAMCSSIKARGQSCLTTSKTA